MFNFVVCGSAVCLPAAFSMPPPGIIDAVEEVHSGGSGDWFPQQEVRYYTNVFLVQPDKLLLGYKKRGLGVHKLISFIVDQVPPN
jgi:hypothetical protein